MRKNKCLILAIVIITAAILSSCSVPQKTATSITTVTTTAEGEMVTAPETQVLEETVEPTATPTEKPTTIPSPTPSPTTSPTPTATHTPLPTPTHTPVPVSIPKNSSVTGERMPKGTPLETWKGIPIPDGAITGQEKKTDWGERYYAFTIQSDIEALQEILTQSLAAANWVSTEGGKGEEIAYAFFTKGKKILRFEFIIEDEDDNLLLVKIFKR